MDLRGANSPLPHCGVNLFQHIRPAIQPTRGEFAPPSLRQVHPGRQPDGTAATRGEFAPPSLRHVRGGGVQWYVNLRGANSPLPHCGFYAEPLRQQGRRLRGANSPLPHCGVPPPTPSSTTCAATRGEFAPPSLRQASRPPLGTGRIPYEGRIRPSLIAAM